MGLPILFLLFVIGLILLWKVGEYTVTQAIGFSGIYGIEQFTIGFFLFAISTGLPEISAAIVSSMENVPELSAGDLMGSTFVNMSLVLGIVTLIAKKLPSDHLRKQLLLTIGLILLLFTSIALFPIETRLTGVLLIALYLAAIFWFQAGMPKKEVAKEVKEVEEKVEKLEKKEILTPKFDIALKLFVGLALLLLSSWLTVYSASQIANRLNINLSLLGGTLLAIGTSLPELALEIHAIRQKEYGLALGDIFGSSLLNISFVLGMLIVINPSVSLSFSRFVLPFAWISGLWIGQLIYRKKAIQIWDGIGLLCLFVAYITTASIKNNFL